MPVFSIGIYQRYVMVHDHQVWMSRHLMNVFLEDAPTTISVMA